MKCAHIAVFVSQHPPSLIPTLPIVSALARRGHRVSFVTSPRFVERVASTGAEIVSCENYPNTTVTEILDWNARTLRDTREFFAQHRPDLVIYELFNFGGLVLAQEWNIPSIQVSPLFALDPEHFLQQTEYPEWGRGLMAMSEQFDSFMERYGIKTNLFFHRDKLNIFFYPRIFQRPGNAFDESCFYAGACAGDQPRYGNWRKNVEEDRPIVLVSSSTTFGQSIEYFRMCIEALTALSVHVIVSIGDRTDISPSDLSAPHVEVVQRVSLVHILQHASLFVCQGGNQSVTEATYHGVPLLLLSRGSLDLEWHASHYARLGVGLHLKDAETNVASIRNAAREILEGVTIRARVKEIQRMIQQEPNGDRTAERIEQQLVN